MHINLRLFGILRLSEKQFPLITGKSLSFSLHEARGKPSRREVFALGGKLIFHSFFTRRLREEKSFKSEFLVRAFRHGTLC